MVRISFDTSRLRLPWRRGGGRQQQVKPGASTAKLVCSGGKLCFVRPAGASPESTPASVPAVTAGERAGLGLRSINVPARVFAGGTLTLGC